MFQMKIIKMNGVIPVSFFVRWKMKNSVLAAAGIRASIVCPLSITAAEAKIQIILSGDARTSAQMRAGLR
jgi:hypothetical protein